MKSNTKHKTACLLMILLMIVIYLPTNNGVLTSTSIGMEEVTDTVTPVEFGAPASSGPDNLERVTPLSILAYTEYTDMDEEFKNTIESIRETYGSDFYLDNLTDYTDLATELPGHDILLIPEQEDAHDSEMTTVGTAWASILDTFVHNGGIVILLDHGGADDYGATSIIYDQSGLMTVSGALDFTFSTAYSNPGGGGANALTRQLAGSWTAPNGALVYTTAAGRWAAGDGAGHPHAVHQLYGKGHIVLLGFDMFARETNSDILLANAIRLHRHVVYDYSHNQVYGVYDAYSDFADDLLAEGYAVSSMNTFDGGIFEAAEALIVAFCDNSYTAGEISSIRAFVEDGGGLWLIGEYGSFGNEIDEIANEFGYDLHDSSRLSDSDDNMGDQYWLYYDEANMNDHSMTVGVTRIEEYYGGGLVNIPADAVWISRTDDDGTAYWDGTTAANNVPWIASSFLQAGRIAVICDGAFLRDDIDQDGDGDINYLDSSHKIFSLNTIRWLAAAGLRNDVVLFDESHSPASTIHVYPQFKVLADYLTINGFTVRWMNTFSVIKISNADILVICDGSSSPAYSGSELTTIGNFVDAGGGLFLIGDHTDHGANVDLIGNEFGLDMHDSGYLDETDDYEAFSSIIVYDDANLGTHPITTGVHRIVADRSTGFDSIGSGTALITTDSDSTCSWSTGGYANGIPVFAATEYGNGRVVAFTDVNFCTDEWDNDGDGDTDFWESDNNLLTINSFLWLVMNRAPSASFTTPNGGEYVSGTHQVIWTANDPDGDSLTFDLYYSPNDGVDWFTIDTYLTGTSYLWDTTALSDGLDYWLGITVYDDDTYDVMVTASSFVVDNTNPAISNLRHSPESPVAGEDVIISVDTSDTNGIFGVLCEYSIDDGDTWVDVLMTHDSGDTYSVDIGSFEAGTIVLYTAGSVDNADLGSGWMTEQSFTIPAPFLILSTDLLLIAGIGGAAVIVIVIILIMKKKK